MPEPPTNPEPVVYQLRVTLRGWIGFSEGASVEWLRHGRRARRDRSQRADLVELLATTLEAVLARTSASDSSN